MFAEKSEGIHPADYFNSYLESSKETTAAPVAAETATPMIEHNEEHQPEVHTDHAQEHHEAATPQERIILNKDMVEDHIGNPENVQWVRAADLLDQVAESCVDGREGKGVISTPGGNAGEFVLMIQAAENISGKSLSNAEVATFFNQYLEKFGKFYMHSDEHAVHHIQHALEGDTRFSGVNLVEAIQNGLPNDPEMQAALLDQLATPDNMGCGHLKLMITQAETYGVRDGVVQAMVRAYFTELWAGNQDVELQMLPGDHLEGAVVNVTFGEPDRELSDEDLVPTIAPLANGTSFFTNHPQATDYLRRHISAQITGEGLLGLTADNQEAYLAEIRRLGGNGLGETVRRLAKDGQGNALPMFGVSFSSQEQYTVEEIQPAAAA